MTDVTTWYSGVDNYKRHTLTVGQERVELVTELRDIDYVPNQSAIDIIADCLQEYNNIELDVYSSFKIYGWEERDEQYKEVFDFCKQHKIEPIISELRHSYFWDGGISCCTQDIRRRGGLESYL